MINTYQYAKLAEDCSKKPYELFKFRVAEARKAIEASKLEKKAKTNRDSQ